MSGRNCRHRQLPEDSIESSGIGYFGGKVTWDKSHFIPTDKRVAARFPADTVTASILDYYHDNMGCINSSQEYVCARRNGDRIQLGTQRSDGGCGWRANWHPLPGEN
jgi:hypothetical protein